MLLRKNNPDLSVKFYVALQGDKTPDQYIRLGKRIEKMGFDRIYVYDDLMYRPAWPILNLIASHTSHIQLGPCLVNGFYRHPAILAENAAFLDELSGGRSVLGVGRGAFFDYLNLQDSEAVTRKACEETILLVKRFLAKSDQPFNGDYFQANEKAVFRFEPLRKEIPIIMGSWNEKMARLAGGLCDEMQVAESWDPAYMDVLYDQMCRGADEGGRHTVPVLSTGGITCISTDRDAAYQKAKETLAVYLPYLKGIMAKNGLDPERADLKEALHQIDHLSKKGQFAEAAALIPNNVVDALSLAGTPGQVKERLENLSRSAPIGGILFSPPYGTGKTIEESLELIMDKVVSKLRAGK